MKIVENILLFLGFNFTAYFLPILILWNYLGTLVLKIIEGDSKETGGTGGTDKHFPLEKVWSKIKCNGVR